MSGGVDSSASALLLKEQGHEVIGLFMRSGSEAAACAPPAGGLPVISRPASRQGCCSAADAADARRVADALDIPFHALDFQHGFGRIKDYFADEYLSGRTPNPCVMCNVWLKFGRLWDFAQQVAADFIATGHYARVRSNPTIAAMPAPEDGQPQTGRDRIGLFRGLDPAKDQSYVLFGIRRELLDRILFPVGAHSKQHIRALARRAGLRTADKPDSQEICFIPDGDYAAFIGRHRRHPDTAGELVDSAGNVLGRHGGYERFTIGQRKGLGVTFGQPRYVVRIEADTHRVVLGSKDELARSTLEADRLNLLVDPWPEHIRCTAQIRYQHTAAACEVRRAAADRLHVTFDEPQLGVTPGQAVVLYDGDQVLGGGWIR